MLIICYRTQNQQAYTMTPLSLDEWSAKNPNVTIDFVFNRTDELFYQSDNQRLQFEEQCNIYGFAPDDYNKPLYDNNGHLCLFVGFLPKNRKYKCRIYDTIKDCYYKVHPNYVKNKLEKCRENQNT